MSFGLNEHAVFTASSIDCGSLGLISQVKPLMVIVHTDDILVSPFPLSGCSLPNRIHIAIHIAIILRGSYPHQWPTPKAVYPELTALAHRNAFTPIDYAHLDHTWVHFCAFGFQANPELQPIQIAFMGLSIGKRGPEHFGQQGGSLPRKSMKDSRIFTASCHFCSCLSDSSFSLRISAVPVIRAAC